MQILSRVFISFWFFGLINNVLYVVILSAAVDLVGPLTPKATVLIADVLPSFIVKLTAPFYIHIIPYTVRIWTLVALSTLGMLIISLSDSVSHVLFGITLASLSSGLGELTFLQLTHYFVGKNALAGFSSGTGGAGLVGSFVFLLLTTWIGVSVKTSLLVFCIVPFMFLLFYFVILPPLGSPTTVLNGLRKRRDSLSVDTESSLDDSLLSSNSSRPSTSTSTFSSSRDEAMTNGKNFNFVRNINSGELKIHVLKTVNKLKPLFFPYMVPLSTVYIAEYVINQGISPTLLFDLQDMPFKQYRDAYVTYGTLYQLGVFISRSSGTFIRIRNLYLPAILQCANLLVCILQSLYVIIPNIYPLFILIFFEGLLGGASYVNTFMSVSENMPIEEREFAMGAVGISDSAGIVIAASISMFLEPRLCQFQVDSGRPWCRSE